MSILAAENWEDYELVHDFVRYFHEDFDEVAGEHLFQHAYNDRYSHDEAEELAAAIGDSEIICEMVAEAEGTYVATTHQTIQDHWFIRVISVEIHCIWRYLPVIMEETMIYEDGRLWPDEIQDTYPTQSGGEEITYECECGDKFATEEEAEQHIEEVQNQ